MAAVLKPIMQSNDMKADSDRRLIFGGFGTITEYDPVRQTAIK